MFVFSARSRSFVLSMASHLLLCHICHAEFDESAEAIILDPVEQINCTGVFKHRFHLYCLAEYWSSTDLQRKFCPICKEEQSEDYVQSVLGRNASVQQLAAEQNQVLAEIQGNQAPAIAETVLDSDSAGRADVVQGPGAEPSEDAGRAVEVGGSAAEPSGGSGRRVSFAVSESELSGDSAGASDAVEVVAPNVSPAAAAGELGEPSDLVAVSDLKTLSPEHKKLRMSDWLVPPSECRPVPVLPRPPGSGAFPGWTLMCYDCGEMVDRNNVRLRSKVHQTFRCGKCRTTITQLFRDHGSWPPKELKDVDLVRKQTFMKSVKDRAAVFFSASNVRKTLVLLLCMFHFSLIMGSFFRAARSIALTWLPDSCFWCHLMRCCLAPLTMQLFSPIFHS